MRTEIRSAVVATNPLCRAMALVLAIVGAASSWSPAAPPTTDAAKQAETPTAGVPAEAPDVVAIPGAIQPHLAIDSSGVATIVALRDGELVLSRSVDQGRTFSPAVVITQTGGKAQGGAQRGPRIGVDSQRRLYISAWLPLGADGQPIATTTHDLFLLRSSDGGQTWSRPQRINATPGQAPENLHWMAVAPNGDVHLAWLDRRDRRRDEGGQDLFYARVDVDRVSSPRKIATLLCECCAPGLAADGVGNVVVAYREGGDKESREIYCLRSRDRGETFAPPQRVNASPTLEKVCPMSAPIVAISPRGDATAILWKDIRSGRNQVFFRHVDAKHVVGENQSGAIQAGAERGVDGRDGVEQNHPSVLLWASGRGYAAWASKMSGRRTIDLCELSPQSTPCSLNSGEWSQADYPILASSETAAGVVYEAWNSGKPAALYHALPPTTAPEKPRSTARSANNRGSS